MLERYICEGLNILRVYNVVGGRCSCGVPGCKAPGKHPAPWRGVKTNRGVYNAKPASECQASDFHAYNLGVACGNGIIVVDIDPRNGGHYAWHDISKGQYLPDTWEVTTGSGGKHIYYRLPEGMTIKSQSFRGIDIQSTGKYVVAPPSMHRDGIAYTWSDDSAETIAQIPPWLIKLLRSHDSAIQAAMIDDDTGGLVVPAGYEWPLLEDILSKLTPRIGYDAWLAVGMGLHSTGAPQAFNLWDTWSAKDPGQYDAEDCLRKWNSFKILPGQRYTYRYLYSLAEMYGIKYGDDNFFVNWKSEPVTVEPNLESAKISESINSIGTLDHGLILNSLFYSALDNALVRSDSLAIACAIQVMSTAVQGTYKSWTDAPLSIYQWVTASASFGKNRYYTFVRNNIKAVHPNLLALSPKSSGGLRVNLQAFNSICSVRDEWHDEFLGLSNSNNEYSKAILSDIKQLFNGNEDLDATIIKGSVQEGVVKPIFGFFGVGTIDGLAECGRIKDFLTSGTASRFLFWIHPDMRDSPEITTRHSFESLDETIGRLREIFEQGLFLQGFPLTPVLDRIKAIQASGTPVKPRKGQEPRQQLKDTPEMKLDRCVEADEQACQKVAEYYQTIRSQVLELDVHSDGDLISIINRQPLAVIKLACLRALSGLRSVVQESDVVWAIQIAESSSGAVKRFFEYTGSGLKYDREKYAVAEKIDLYLRGKPPMTIGAITKQVRFMRSTVEECLVHLMAQGQIIAIDRGGNRVYNSKINDKMCFVRNTEGH